MSWFMVVFIGFARLASSATICFSFVTSLKIILNMFCKRLIRIAKRNILSPSLFLLFCTPYLVEENIGC